jgi:hypothetical protein
MAETLSEIPEEDESRSAREAEYQAVSVFDVHARGAIEHMERSARQTLLVPSSLIQTIREGAYGLLASASDDIARSSHSQVRPEPDTRLRLDQAWALLDRLGWMPCAVEAEQMQISIAEHGETLLAAVDVIVPLLEGWLDDMDPADSQKPEGADAVRLTRQFQVQARQAVRREDT